MTQKLKAEIDLTLNDEKARRGIEGFNRMAEKAQKTAAGIQLGGRGGSGAGSLPDVSSTASAGSAVPGASTTSTAARSSWSHLNLPSNQAMYVRGAQVLSTGAGYAGQGAYNYASGALQRSAATFAGGVSDPGMSIRLAGQGVAGSLRLVGGMLSGFAGLLGGARGAIASALTGFPLPASGGVFGALLKGAGAGFAGAGEVAEIAAGFVAQGMNLRYGVMQQLASIERPQSIAAATGRGFNLKSLAGAAVKGFRPTEAAPILAQYSTQIGAVGARGTPDPFSLILAGVDPGVVATLIGQGAAGGGLAGGMRGSVIFAHQAVGLAQGQGLRGRQTNEYVGRLNQLASQFAEQSLRYNGAGGARFINAAYDVGSNYADQTGINPFAGMEGPRALARLGGAGLGSLSNFRGQFAGLADAALLSAAFSNASSPMEAIARLEEMASDPLKVQEAIRSQLGSEAASLAFAGRGFSRTQSELLALAPFEGDDPSMGMGLGGRPQIYNRMFAESELRHMTRVAGDEGLNRELVKSVDQMKDIFLQLSVYGKPLIREINTLITHIRELIGRRP